MTVEAQESASPDPEATLEFTDDEKRANDIGIAGVIGYESPLQRSGAVILRPEEVRGMTEEQIYDLMVVRSRL